MEKKRSVVSLNLSKHSVMILQTIGIMDGRKRIIKGKNVSDFFNRLLETNYGSSGWRQKYLKGEIIAARKKQDRTAKEIELLAIELDQCRREETPEISNATR